MGVPNNFLYQQKCLKDILKTVVPNPFVTTDRSMLDTFSPALEYFRISDSMGRISQSHALKASGVTTSIRFVISRPGD